MKRLPAIDPSTATGETKKALDAVEARTGHSPNVMRTIANSPVALLGYVALDSALSEGTLSPRMREQIALAVAETNSCQSCVAAHLEAGKLLGLDEGAIRAAREASSSDPKTAAALQFARTVAEYRGDLTDDEFDRVRRAGYTDSEIAEIIANVVLCLYANYFNSIARTEIDVPVRDLPARSETDRG
ncbi:MAG TPA: carboxymuconolactone decarboxylase family protein [Chloroflexota bacterium]